MQVTDFRCRMRFGAKLREGKTFYEIGSSLKYPLTTVRNWLIRFQSEGILRKCNKKQPGRSKRLTDEQIENLKPILSKSPQNRVFHS